MAVNPAFELLFGSGPFHLPECLRKLYVSVLVIGKDIYAVGRILKPWKQTSHPFVGLEYHISFYLFIVLFSEEESGYDVPY